MSLSSTAVIHGPSNVQLQASCTLGAPIVPAGSTTRNAVDLPAAIPFQATGCKVMFQNPARENNAPTNPVGGGCPRFGGVVFDQHAHWLDGFHFFIGFTQTWNGAQWVHSAQIGEYDPSPDGGFPFIELGINAGNGWISSDPFASFGTHWNVSIAGSTVTVSVDGTVSSADATNCWNGVFNRVFARAGDLIDNIKGLTTADVLLTLPVTVPLNLGPGLSNITTAGGYMFFSDTTAGNSWNVGSVGNVLRPNISNIAFSTGVVERNRGAGSVIQDQEEPTRASDGGGGSQPGPRPSDPVDTLGESPACPTPTFGGLLPRNPWMSTDFGCHYDDDNVPMPSTLNPVGPWVPINPGERGTFLAEFWDTNFRIIA